MMKRITVLILVAIWLVGCGGVKNIKPNNYIGKSDAWKNRHAKKNLQPQEKPEVEPIWGRHLMSMFAKAGLNIDADSNDAADLLYGGTNSALTDPGADRILFWDDGAALGSNVAWLTLGSGLTFNGTTLEVGTSFNPDTADGAALGSVDLEWSDLYLAASGVIYGEADQSNTLTSSATGWTANLNLAAATYGSDGSVSDAKLLYINSLSSNAQDQISARQTTLTNEAGLYAALSDVADFVQPSEKFTMGATIAETVNADTTPDVSNAALGTNNIYRSNANGTITDFDDADDHSEFSDGDFFIFILDDASVLNFNGNSDLNRPGNLDYTGSATQPTVIIFEYLDAAWHTTSLSPAATSPTTLSVGAIETPTLQEDEWNDEADDRLLTVAELKNKIISNAGLSADTHFDAPVVTEGWNVIFIIEAAYQVDVHPNDSQTWYLNGTVMGADEMISNSADTVGESMACFSTEAGKVYCESKYANFAAVAEPI